jgi:translation elongation factor EF-4
MRDVFAAVLAIVLLAVAASLATTLTAMRRRRLRARDSERALGRTVVAEIPADDDLRLFSEDAVRFHYGEASVDKDLIVAVRVLINGSPIAAYVSTRHPANQARQATSFEDRPEGIARDRWDVAIETVTGTLLVECGAIRERVSQELARSVFDVVKADVERRDYHSVSGTPPR